MRDHDHGRVKTNDLFRHRYSPTEIDQLLKEYRSSQLTQREFAELHDVGLSTLQNWLRKAQPKPKSPVEWIELSGRPQIEPKSKSSSYEIEMGGAVLRLSPGFNPQEAEQLVGILAKAV